MKIKTKLMVVSLVAFAVLMLMWAGVYQQAVARAQTMHQAVTSMTERSQLAQAWESQTRTNAVRTQIAVLNVEPGLNAVLKKDIESTSAAISDLQKKLSGQALADDDKAVMDKIAGRRKAMLDVRAKANEMRADVIASKGKIDDVHAFMGNQYQPAVAAYLEALGAFSELQNKKLAEARTAVESSNHGALRLGLLLTLLVVAVAGAELIWLLKTIRAPLDQAAGLASRIAGGDLGGSPLPPRQDEFADLMHALQSMREGLTDMVQQVRQNTDNIATASEQIATGNQDLSVRTEKTSANLAEAASTMDTLTHAVQQGADNASQASQLAHQASEVAERGGKMVEEVVSTMGEIHTSSQRIGDITGVIDSIAFQTNILALNAAVEAARAGEQGRGFAVVASEVRSLAQRSAQAAREIKELIGHSVAKVDSGSRVVQETGAVMTDIVNSVRRVNDVIAEITAAATEQSSGIRDVNSSVASLDQMTQQNAALVEQSAAAAQSLRDQAEQLERAVGAFKLGRARD